MRYWFLVLVGVGVVVVVVLLTTRDSDSYLCARAILRHLLSHIDWSGCGGAGGAGGRGGADSRALGCVHGNDLDWLARWIHDLSRAL